MINLKTYQINVDKQYILEYYVGKFDVDELIDFKKQVSADKLYNANFNVIHDFRDAEFNFAFEDVGSYVETLQNNTKMVGKRKSVTITKTPNQVTTSISFDSKKKQLPIYFKITSTIEAALEFINLPKSEHSIVTDYFKMNKIKLENQSNL